jgi:hypothetical protein
MNMFGTREVKYRQQGAGAPSATGLQDEKANG